VRRFLKRTVRAIRLAAADKRIPAPLRVLAGIGLAPVPGPFDEAPLLIIGFPLALFYREPLADAWRRAKLQRDSQGQDHYGNDEEGALRLGESEDEVELRRSGKGLEEGESGGSFMSPTTRKRLFGRGSAAMNSAAIAHCRRRSVRPLLLGNGVGCIEGGRSGRLRLRIST
jgi:hypothetical protein